MSLEVSTLSGNVNRPATGDPVRMMAEVSVSLSVRAVANVRLRRRCPNPKVSWL